MDKILTIVDFLNENGGTDDQWDALLERILDELSRSEALWLMHYRKLGGSLYTDLSMRLGENGY